MKTLVLAIVCMVCGAVMLTARGSSAPAQFFPMKVGTYWVYEGSVSWYDFTKEQRATERVSWRMSVDRVIRKEGVVAAVVTGFPADLDWSGGEAEPKQWLFLEDAKHGVHYLEMGPDFDLAKYEKGNQSFDKFLVPDALLFEWPLKKGAKFCGDEDQKKREDNMYCWFVTRAEKRKLDNVKGAPAGEQEVFELKYMSNPDDTTMEWVAGIGLVAYQYHHHGSVADTELQLVEFHPVAESGEGSGTKP
jgi:hypothetical protein